MPSYDRVLYSSVGKRVYLSVVKESTIQVDHDGKPVVKQAKAPKPPK